MDLAALDFVPDAVIAINRDGTIRFANRTTEQMFGYARNELVGVPLEVLIPSRFRAAHRAHTAGYFTAPRTRPMGIGMRLTALRKDGHEFAVDISLAPLDLGSETLAVAAVRDATERVAFEERERQLRRAEQEIRERDEILTIASHELRAPVGSLQLQIGMLQRVASTTANDVGQLRDALSRTATDLDGMRERMGKVERQARRLARLIEQLLDASHVRTGSFPLKLEDTDLADLTRETVASLREEVERTGSALTLVADTPVLGTWDPIRIEQVIANLLLNAAKFGRGNPITVNVDGNEALARVSVTDEGIGIAPEDHDRIFLPFERAVAIGGVIGLGLGLYIAGKIVDAHGGSLSLRSVAGEGSTFRVELPRRGKS
jgi:two-component system sensor kinase FixL